MLSQESHADQAASSTGWIKFDLFNARRGPSICRQSVHSRRSTSAGALKLLIVTQKLDPLKLTTNIVSPFLLDHPVADQRAQSFSEGHLPTFVFPHSTKLALGGCTVLEEEYKGAVHIAGAHFQ